MKKKLLSICLTAICSLSMLITPNQAMAQEEGSKNHFSVGGDLVSSYVWRGSKFGSGPAVQPYVEAAFGNFAVGVWGSYCFSAIEAAEADLYLSYAFNFGLSIGLTDYYFPGNPYFDITSERSHGFEINLGYEIAGFSVGANYMLNEAAGAGTDGGDMYFELAYDWEHFGIFVGGGNGWHTYEDPADPDESDFMVCNVGLTTSTEIQITERYALPLSGTVILNPDTQDFHVVVGISF